jgi:hypothetical protein
VGAKGSHRRCQCVANDLDHFLRDVAKAKAGNKAQIFHLCWIESHEADCRSIGGREVIARDCDPKAQRIAAVDPSPSKPVKPSITATSGCN